MNMTLGISVRSATRDIDDNHSWPATKSVFCERAWCVGGGAVLVRCAQGARRCVRVEGNGLKDPDTALGLSAAPMCGRVQSTTTGNFPGCYFGASVGTLLLVVRSALPGVRIISETTFPDFLSALVASLRAARKDFHGYSAPPQTVRSQSKTREELQTIAKVQRPSTLLCATKAVLIDDNGRHARLPDSTSTPDSRAVRSCAPLPQPTDDFDDLLGEFVADARSSRRLRRPVGRTRSRPSVPPRQFQQPRPERQPRTSQRLE